MKKPIILVAAFLLAAFFSYTAKAQLSNVNLGQIHGNFEATAQYYNSDSLIGAPEVPEKLLMNGYLNLTYTRGNFSAGLRYESYLNTLQGFPPGYKGNGIPFRYASYTTEKLQVTAGNYYEQFGNGLIFRSYEERGLGYDNAMDGLRVKYEPYKGIYLKGVIGRQRLYFDYGPGIVRGLDSEININELCEGLNDKKTTVVVGGSFLSKFQADQDPTYILPENVGAWAGRINIARGGVRFLTEYAQKINDPSADNGFIYKPGEAIFSSISYSQKGFGATLSAKVIDNMSFRSDRGASVNDLLINYLPALTKQHTYNLAATLYPYATQPNGEAALQAEVIYKIKKGSKLGGKYGTSIAVNYSAANNIDTTALNDLGTVRNGYKTNFFNYGDKVYFKDFNIELTKKFSSKFKLKATYINLVFNNAVLLLAEKAKGTIYADIAVLDVLYKIKPKHAIRTELQHMSTKQDLGNWATGVIEYTFSPHWFVGVMDQYNYGNSDPEKKIHYLIGTVGYTNKANRFSILYGRQRAGIFCVGGVCRNVPASNGLTFTITSSF